MNLDDTMFDIDQLAKKIESRLNELNEYEEEPKKKRVIDTVNDFGDLLDQIELKLRSIEEKELLDAINIDEVTAKINQKLDTMQDEDELDKTLYDLSEISQMINKTVSNLEKERIKKAKKAKYCEMARKNNQQNKKYNNKNKNNKGK